MNHPSSSPALSGFAGAAGGTFEQRAVLGAFAAMPRGHLRLELPDGSAGEFGAGPEHLPLGVPATASIRVLRPAFFKKCFWAGDIGFAEAFIDGDWETPDIAAVVAWFILNVNHAPTLSGSQQARSFALNFLRVANRVGHLLRPNSRAMARRNIREHYDLSNDFFALFLDPAMMYSGAHWPRPGLTLAEAQREKNDALCRKLRLTPADHVLEIGTGWGGWSLHAAQTYGCRVTTVTISQQQFDLARRRIAEAGLDGRVDVQLCDYRDPPAATTRSSRSR